MRITITIDADNAAFEGDDIGPETARILADLARKLERADRHYVRTNDPDPDMGRQRESRRLPVCPGLIHPTTPAPVARRHSGDRRMSEIRHRDIRGFKCRYHRNGISGEGFFLCEFLLRQGQEFKTMRCVVFDEPGRIAVISADIAERWRGDEFEKTIRDAVARAMENQEVFSA